MLAVLGDKTGEFNLHDSETGAIIIPILQMRKLKFRDEVITLPGATQPVNAKCTSVPQDRCHCSPH